ncbi:MAG: hypothetical protein HZB43_10160 [candidate division Zixibacteria bacterium]|nr:hypothetical protein [candidate division Zixibacteria bacterium]
MTYLLLAIIATRPLLANALHFTPRGSGSGDQCQFIWFFWWTKIALFQLHQSPFWTDVIYFPYGTELAHHSCLFTNMLAILVSSVSGIPINAPLLYNLFVLLSFMVGGLASFALIRYVTGYSLAAFAGSLVFTFSPYFLFHLEHLNLLFLGWGILAIYFSLRFLDSSLWSDLIWAGVFFTIQLYSSLTNAMQVGSFLVLYLLLSVRQIWAHPERGRLIWRGLLGALATIPLALPLLISLKNARAAWPLTWRDSIPRSASLPDFIVPSSRMQQPEPGEVFLGWLILGLALAALLYPAHKSRRKWAALAGIFLILSLGPSLALGDRVYLDGWLPYRWLYGVVPYFSLSRTPARFVIVAQLCLAVLIGIGFAAVLSYTQRRIGRLLRMVIISAGEVLLAVAIYVLYIRGPIELSRMDVPAVYEQIKADSTIKVICDLPISEKLQICNWYLYWQTEHCRKAVNGYLAHHSQTATGLIDTIKTWQGFGPAEKALLIADGVDAVVLHDPEKESQLIRLK